MIGIGIRRRPRAFSPRDLNPSLWLRADRGITLNGSDVSAWVPIIGSGVTVSQGTGAQQPAFATLSNGLPTLRGHTNASKLNVTGHSAPTAGTLFLVLSRTTNGNSYVLGNNGGTAGIIENFAANTLEWFNGNGTDRLSFAATRTAGLHIAAVTQTNGGALTLYYDGSQAASKGTAAASLWSIVTILGYSAGVTSGTDGDVPELVYFDRVLSAGDLTTMDDYLSRRYGTP